MSLPCIAAPPRDCINTAWLPAGVSTGLVMTAQYSLLLILQEPGASLSKAKAAPEPHLPYLGEDAEEREEEELLLQLEPHAALPSTTSAHHPPGSLEAAACSQVLKPRVGPAGVYTLPALMSLTGSNINMSRFGQASRFFFFLLSFFIFFFQSTFQLPFPLLSR